MFCLISTANRRNDDLDTVGEGAPAEVEFILDLIVRLDSTASRPKSKVVVCDG